MNLTGAENSFDLRNRVVLEDNVEVRNKLQRLIQEQEQEHARTRRICEIQKNISVKQSVGAFI